MYYHPIAIQSNWIDGAMNEILRNPYWLDKLGKIRVLSLGRDVLGLFRQSTCQHARSKLINFRSAEFHFPARTSQQTDGEQT